MLFKLGVESHLHVLNLVSHLPGQQNNGQPLLRYPDQPLSCLVYLPALKQVALGS